MFLFVGIYPIIIMIGVFLSHLMHIYITVQHKKYVVKGSFYLTIYTTLIDTNALS